MTGAIILRVAYGYSINRERLDPLVDLVDRTMQHASEAFVPGAWIVDFIPSRAFFISMSPI